MNLQFIAQKAYYDIQRAAVLPVVNTFYKLNIQRQRNDILEDGSPSVETGGATRQDTVRSIALTLASTCPRTVSW